uniref:Uncharacterized protein n=1 Tax=Trichuris muris TaxID=70415 RepID=A0A5S6R651_TRIMR
MSILQDSALAGECYLPSKVCPSIADDMIVPDRILVVGGGIKQTSHSDPISGSYDRQGVSACRPSYMPAAANQLLNSSVSNDTDSGCRQAVAKVVQTKDKVNANFERFRRRRVIGRNLSEEQTESDEDSSEGEAHKLRRSIRVRDDRLNRMQAQISECLWILRFSCAFFCIGLVALVVSKLRRRI